MDANKVIEIDVKKCLSALKKSIKQVMLVTLIFTLIGIFFAFFAIRQKNQYKATSTVYSIVYGSFDASTDSLRAMMQYSDIVKSYKVAERAELILGASSVKKEDIYNMISASYNQSNGTYSSKIYINAISDDKNLSISVANAVADAFVLEIANLTGHDDIQTLDKAANAIVYYNAASARIKTIITITFLGALIASIYIVLKETLSTKMYMPKDATLYGTLDIIGVIPEFNQKQ